MDDPTTVLWCPVCEESWVFDSRVEVIEDLTGFYQWIEETLKEHAVSHIEDYANAGHDGAE